MADGGALGTIAGEHGKRVKQAHLIYVAFRDEPTRWKRSPKCWRCWGGAGAPPQPWTRPACSPPGSGMRSWWRPSGMRGMASKEAGL